jgi:hypothetical protein
MLRPTYLSKRLSQPLSTKDGGTLRTVRDACEYMAAIGQARELQHRWRRGCELILEEAEVPAVTRQL